MDEQILFFKDKIISDNDLEIVFHKDYIWIYDENPKPVVSYTLSNCKDLDKVNFTFIDDHNDGVVVETRLENNRSVFETSDMGGIKVTIVCEKIIKNEHEYRKDDFIDLIKEFQRQRDKENETVKLLSDRLEDIRKFLKKELDISERKRNHADWLNESKKQYIEGQQDILNKVINAINIREREDFEKKQKLNDPS